jgi:hypothetical protein
MPSFRFHVTEMVEIDALVVFHCRSWTLLTCLLKEAHIQSSAEADITR